MVIDTGSESGSVAGVACVFVQLHTPESITAAVDRTTALMGVQKADDHGLHYSWSYHPDNGLNIVITQNG